MLYARVRQATAGEHALCHVLVSVFTASVWGWATLWEGLFCALVRTESVLMSLTCLRKKSHIVSSWQISMLASEIVILTLLTRCTLAIFTHCSFGVLAHLSRQVHRPGQCSVHGQRTVHALVIFMHLTPSVCTCCPYLACMLLPPSVLCIAHHPNTREHTPKTKTLLISPASAAPLPCAQQSPFTYALHLSPLSSTC
jgi:hypothetical protein